MIPKTAQATLAERVHAFFVLITLVGAASLVQTASADSLYADAADDAAAFAAKPEVSAEKAATRLNVRAGTQTVSNFLVSSMVSVVDLGVVLVVLAFTCGAVYVVPNVVDDILIRFTVPRHVRAIVLTLVRVLICIAGVWLALTAIGIDFAGILLSFGVVGIVLGNGLGTPVSNAAAGILHNNEDLQPGSRIMINEIPGVVEETGFLTLCLRLDDGRIYVVPNSAFLQMPWYVLDDRAPAAAAEDDPLARFTNVGKNR